MFVSKHLSLLALPVLVVVGCAAPAGEEADPGDEVTDEMAQEELGTSRAALAHLSCATAPVDAELDMSSATSKEVTSPSSGYATANASCIGNYLVRVKNPYASSFELYARYSGPAPADRGRCERSWVEMTPFYYVYKPTVAEYTWTKGESVVVRGTWGVVYDAKTRRFEQGCRFPQASVSVTRSATFPVFDVRIAANAVYAIEDFWSPAVFVPVTAGFRR